MKIFARARGLRAREENIRFLSRILPVPRRADPGGALWRKACAKTACHGYHAATGRPMPGNVANLANYFHSSKFSRISLTSFARMRIGLPFSRISLPSAI